jgi:hypothetical protein
MNIIKLDVDGVIRDTFSVMCNLYNMKFGTYMVPEDIFAYDVNVSFPLVQEQLGVSAAEWFFQIHSEDCFLNAPAFDGVADAIRKLRQQGDKIVICTYQPTYAGRINTIMFLENNGIEFDELHLTEQKWAVLGDVIIDDCPNFLTHPREKCDKICVDYKFNRHLTQFTFDKGNRVHSTVEALNKFIV